MPRFSADLIVYVAEVFADECRDVLLYGSRSLGITVTFDESLYRFDMVVGLDELTSFRGAEAENRDWRLLSAILKRVRPDLRMVWDSNVKQGLAAITVVMQTPQYLVAVP
jgi:hypothetical protein